MNPFACRGMQSQWEEALDYARHMQFGDLVRISEIATVINATIPDPLLHIDEDQARAIVMTMNDKRDAIAEGIVLMSVPGGEGFYKKATPEDIRHYATKTVPRKMLSQAERGKLRLTAVENHPDSTDRDKEAAMQGKLHYGTLTKVLKEEKKELKKLAPERPKYQPPMPSLI